jgi:hypothetical protein
MTTSELADRAERAARNQTLFRQVNERIEALNESFGVVLPVGEWVCECADERCSQLVELTIPEYEHVRSLATRFFVAPGDEHVWPDLERVVERHERYWVVEKLGEAGAIADELHPRS